MIARLITSADAQSHDSRAVEPCREATPPLISDYQLDLLIGMGGYGEVWRAQGVTGELHALKLIYQNRFDDERPFQREIQGITRFGPISRTHPHLMPILHIGENRAQGFFYYVMELADNDSADPKNYHAATLKSLLKSHGRIRAERCISLAIELAAALEYLHEHGLVHRDVKPSNILFVKGVAKLADPGLVAPSDVTASVVGTLGYLPPEGAGRPQADIYSLGKVLYCAAFGAAPQDFPRLPAELRAWPDAKLLLELNEVVTKASAHDPKQRYTSPREILSDLKSLEQGRSVKRRNAIRRISRRAAFFAVAALIITLAVFSVLSFASHPRGSVKWSTNEEANRAFHNGILAFHQNSAGSMSKAVEHFERAVALDSSFARAYARLAFSIFWLNVADPNGLAKAHALAERAVALDPQSDDAHLALGAITGGYNQDSATAEKHNKLAISLNPYSDENFYNYACFLVIMGRTNEARVQLQKAEHLDSRSFLALQYAAFVYEGLRDYDKVIKKVEDHLQTDPSSKGRLTQRFLVPAYREKGDYRTAIALEKQAALLNGHSAEEAQAHADQLLAALESGGQQAYWQQRLDWAKSKPGETVLLAALFARVGNTKSALDLLEEAFSTTPAWVRFEINRDPAFDSLRDHPRFKVLLQKLHMAQ